MFQVLFVLTFALLLYSAKAICQDGWVSYGSSCYKFDVLSSSTWRECYFKCEDLNASMLCITDDETNTWITSQMKRSFFLIGFYMDSPDVLSWVEGCSSTYTNWDFGQPFGKYISHQLYL